MIIYADEWMWIETQKLSSDSTENITSIFMITLIGFLSGIAYAEEKGSYTIQTCNFPHSSSFIFASDNP